jgi:hypothetical protein
MLVGVPRLVIVIWFVFVGFHDDHLSKSSSSYPTCVTARAAADPVGPTMTCHFTPLGSDLQLRAARSSLLR